MYDFLLVINTNLPPILHRFRDIAFDRSKIAIFGYPSCVEIPRRSGSLCHIMVHDISLKTRFLGYISMTESLAISSTTFTQCAPEATEFHEITQNNGYYAVQGHSRSPILEPIDFLLVINTNLPPILLCFRDIAFDRSKIAIFGYPSCL